MNQRERFEAAWLASEKAEGDHAVLMFERSEHFIGKYFDIEVEAAWKAWQLAEASGLELAAKVCDQTATSVIAGLSFDRYAVEEANIKESLASDLAADIRALLAREGE